MMNHCLCNENRDAQYKGFMAGKPKRSMKSSLEPNPLYSTSQSLFPSKKTSSKMIQLQNPRRNELYQTLGNSTNWGGWTRPESKQAFRKTAARPETSKGTRTESRNNHAVQQYESGVRKEFKPMTSSSSSNIKRVVKRKSKKYEEIQRKENMSREETSTGTEDIEIVVNRKAACKKGESIHKNKFQTDLDDEFLELFAD